MFRMLQYQTFFADAHDSSPTFTFAARADPFERPVHATNLARAPPFASRHQHHRDGSRALNPLMLLLRELRRRAVGACV